jgi:predicted transcriptional regulator
MTQHEDRIQQRMDKATAKRHQGEWVKHTINLRKGTTLNTRMQECGNKSHLVRETFKRFLELKHEIDHLREENTIMRENIAKLQARLVEDDEEKVIIHPGQTTFEVIE